MVKEYHTQILIRCGWCKKDMGVKDGQGQTGISDGICSECLEDEMEKIQEGHERQTDVKSHQGIDGNSSGPLTREPESSPATVSK